MRGTCQFGSYPHAVGYDSVELWITDWLQGFNANLESTVLTAGIDFARSKNIKRIRTAFVFDERIRNRYPDLEFKYDQTLYNGYGWEKMQSINTHPVLKFENFLCSFNGGGEVGRQLLVAVLAKNGWFDTAYCTKNFQCSNNQIDGHIQKLSVNPDLHLKFFCGRELDDLFASINSVNYDQFDHVSNYFHLAPMLTKSFVNLVADVDATGYYPMLSEKFLHSLVSRGLFLSFAPPYWHRNFHIMFGFKKYDKIFDYEFDVVHNPVERLVKLICMLSAYSKLTQKDWHDLYLLNLDEIEHNYDHYFSNSHLSSIERYENNFSIT